VDEGCLEHLDHLLGVGVRGAELPAARRCRVLRSWHHRHPRSRNTGWSVALLSAESTAVSRQPAAGIRHPASGIRHPASGIRHGDIPRDAQEPHLLAIQPGHPLAAAADGSWYPFASRPRHQ
jgi:hypothetical protein